MNVNWIHGPKLLPSLLQSPDERKDKSVKIQGFPADCFKDHSIRYGHALMESDF